jgi:hypothetical protein
MCCLETRSVEIELVLGGCSETVEALLPYSRFGVAPLLAGNRVALPTAIPRDMSGHRRTECPCVSQCQGYVNAHSGV